MAVIQRATAATTTVSSSVLITVAPTGPVATTADSPFLPVSPEQISVEVAEAYSLGAAVAHLHFRDKNEQPTADLDIARRTIDLIRQRCPILVQLSTGVGLTVPFEERAKLVELRPQMATLNPCSMSFGDGEFSNPPAAVRRLAGRMQELGVKPELEIYDTGHLDMCLRLRDEGLLEDPLQFSIVLGVRGGLAATPENLMMMFKRLPEECVWQVVAVGRHHLQLTSMAIALGGNARTGLEDTLHLRKGELSPGNGPLVERLGRLVAALDKKPVTPTAAASMLRLTPN